MQNEIFITLPHDLPLEKIIEFVNEANHFESYILIQTGRYQLNVKSLLSAIAIREFHKESTIHLKEEGSDSRIALEHLTSILTS